MNTNKNYLITTILVPSSKIHYPVPNLGNWYPFFCNDYWWNQWKSCTCSLSSKIQYCKGDSTSVIFVEGLYILGIKDTL